MKKKIIPAAKMASSAVNPMAAEAAPQSAQSSPSM
jgi:hypothetical protein